MSLLIMAMGKGLVAGPGTMEYEQAIKVKAPKNYDNTIKNTC